MSVTLAAGLGLAALLVWALVALVRERGRVRMGALSRVNETLEAEIESRTSALREAHARLQSIIHSAVDGIIVIDHAGCIEEFNPGAERLFGYAAAEVIGRNIHILMPSPYHEEHDGYLARYLATGEPHIIGIGRAVTGRRQDGATFPLHLSVGEMRLGDQRKFTGIVHDLTDRTRMEAQLREQAALVRLGEMAAVIAHEVKNPLAAVRGAIQVIGSRLPAGSAETAVVGEVLTRIDTLNDLVRDLLLFARPPKPQPAPVDVRSLIAMTADLLRQDPALGSVEVTVEGEAPPVRADPEMLKIVFQNLLVNSAQAVDGQGRVAVVVAVEKGDCLVTVRDSGPGILPEVRGHLFTPFFTTKARGTGLGLVTARRLLDAHQGTIDVTCPPDGGTVVTVRLPASVPA